VSSRSQSGAESSRGKGHCPESRTPLDLGYRWFAKNRFWLTGRRAEGACTVDSERSKAQLRVLLFQGDVPRGQ
jgi:hypothetical protein